MLNNFLAWGGKRIDEIPNDAQVSAENKSIEISKLNDRLGKFKDKMGFLENLKGEMASAVFDKSRMRNGSVSVKSMESS